MYTYKSSQQERVEVGYLAKASPEEVVRWLRDNYKEPRKGIYGETLDLHKDDGRRLIEFMLSRRRDALIDHGLARFGYSRYAIQKAADRGDVSTRAAAVGNIRGGVALKNAHTILRTGKYSLLNAMLQNKWLSGRYIEVLLRRKGAYADISDDRFALIVSAITGNARLMTPYESERLDGFDEYEYHLPFQAAWDLTRIVPANQLWAGILWDLLEKTQPSGPIDNLVAVIERWNIDVTPTKPGKWYSRSPSFFVRSLLYNRMQPDSTLLGSPDAACRHSFYRRFSPREFPDWPRFLKIDGEEFTVAALQNENLWESEAQRQTLYQVCSLTPDEHHTMEMQNDFRRCEKGHRERHPEWFVDGTDATSREPLAEILERLDRMEEALQALPRKRGLF